MATAVIVDAVRTAGGKRNGRLSGWHPADLASEALNALVKRNDFDPAVVEDVIMGCVMQAGAQSINIARNAVLAAGWPEEVPATSIDRQCGSSQQAVHFAAQAVMSGAHDVVVASGVEVMSQVPMGASVGDGRYGLPFGERMGLRYADVGGLIPQGLSAELIADKWGLRREDLDAFALRSQQNAARARDEGRFENEIVPVVEIHRDKDTGNVVKTKEQVTADEGIRESSMESLGNLKPAFKPDGGKVTAGNSSQITDGASAALIMSEEKAAELGLLLNKAGLGLDDIDLVEINEAFASVVLAWEKETGADMDKVNVNGGAIALGHPLGASGTKLLATLLNELERSNGRWGLLTMCEGGGLANATVIERL